jgi:lambda family phage portal protein
LEADHCDHQFQGVATNGNRIIMGVEIDADGAPAAYYFSTRHPGESHGGQDRRRIPADEIVHVFVQTRQGQLRGVPSAHASMLRLQLLKGYEEAEVVAARVGACKQLFYSNPNGEWDQEKDGVPAFDMEPGTAEVLPPGWSAELMAPQHPTTQFHSFCKSLKQGIASGLNIAYNTWANDLEGVSFSSIRSGVQEERDNWRIKQQEMIEILNRPIYEAWLKMALLTQELPLPFSDFDELTGVNWMPRGWSWVDPLKDMKANIVARDQGWKSDQQISAELGAGDLEDNLKQNQQADKLREKYNQSKLTPAESAALLADDGTDEGADETIQNQTTSTEAAA